MKKHVTVARDYVRGTVTERYTHPFTDNYQKANYNS